MSHRDSLSLRRAGAGLFAAWIGSGGVWAGSPSFLDLHGAFPGAESTHATAISADGGTAVGWVDFGPGNSDFGAVWDLSTGTGALLPEPAGVLPGTVTAHGVSADGSIITGSGWTGTTRALIRWENGSPSIVSGSQWVDNFSLSRDGSVAVGRVQQAGNQWRAARWTAGGGVQALEPLLPGTSPGTAFGVSDSAGVIVGNSMGQIFDPLYPGFVVQLATWWSGSGTPNRLSVAGELFSDALGVSADGRFVVGTGVFSTGMSSAMLWDLSTGDHRFLTREVIASGVARPTASRITPDGSVVALNAHELGSSGVGLWSEAVGLRSLRDVLETDFRIDQSHWVLSTVGGITIVGDGSIVMTGEGNFRTDPNDPFTQSRRAFAASLPSFAGSGVTPGCEPLWEAPALLATPGLTDINGDPDPAGVTDLVAFDGDLYALGSFNRAGGANIGAGVARWNGSAWSSAGVGLGGVSPSAGTGVVFDDGGGPALYVGGFFSIAGGQFVDNIARWDGTQWSPVGSSGPNGVVRQMVVFDDGGGPALYIGGGFTQVAGIAVNGLARWDGASWSAFGLPAGGGSLNIGPTSMVVHDDGTGPALYISGSFQTVDGVPAAGIAKWDGAAWSAVGDGLSGWADHMESFDGGDGADLYLVGSFAAAGGVPMSGLVRWDGLVYSQVAGVQSSVVRDLEVLDDGRGPALMISVDGGVFTDGITQVERVVGGGLLRWDGARLTRVGLPNEGLAGFSVPGPLTAYDDGEGPAIYVAGDFGFIMSDAAGGVVVAGNIARLAPCEPAQQPCPGDLTGDGLADLADINAFVGGFTNQQAIADMNADGVFDLLDINAFVAAFLAGCP